MRTTRYCRSNKAAEFSLKKLILNNPLLLRFRSLLCRGRAPCFWKSTGHLNNSNKQTNSNHSRSTKERKAFPIRYRALLPCSRECPTEMLGPTFRSKLKTKLTCSGRIIPHNKTWTTCWLDKHIWVHSINNNNNNYNNISNSFSSTTARTATFWCLQETRREESRLCSAPANSKTRMDSPCILT